MEIFRLFGSILVNTDQAEKSLQKTDKHAQSVGTTFAKGVGTVAKWGAAIGGAAVAGAGALLGIATKASSAAAEIDDMSQRTNLSAKTLQEYKYAAEQSGFSLDTIESSAKKLTVTMGNYAKGNKTTISAFKELGLSAEGAKGKLKTTDEMFPQIIAKLADMKDITERNNLLVKIFGKSASDMAPMLNEGSKGVKELTDKAHSLGLVMSDESVKAGAKFDDTMQTVKSSLGMVGTQVGMKVMPLVQKGLDWVLEHMPQIQDICGKVFGFIGDSVKAVGGFVDNPLMPALNGFLGWIAPHMPEIKQFIIDTFNTAKERIKEVITVISDVIKWCIKYKEILIPLGAGIAAGALTFGIYTLAIHAWTIATALATGAATTFGAVMTFITSPIGIVVLTIGGLIAVGVLLYRNWDKVSGFLKFCWNGIKTTAVNIFGSIANFFKKWGPLILAILAGPIGILVYTIAKHWNSIKSTTISVFSAIGKFIGGITKGIEGGFKGMVNGVIKALNFMIRALDKLHFSIPDWIPGGLGGKEFGIHLSQIPSFAVGTKYLPDDMLVYAHEGEMIVPKSENVYANSNGKILPNKQNPIICIVQLDGKEIARTIVDPMSEELERKKQQNNMAYGGAY